MVEPLWGLLVPTACRGSGRTSIREQSFWLVVSQETLEGSDPMGNASETEVARRSLAVEGALLVLIERLALRGVVGADEAEEMLELIAKSCDVSAARASTHLQLVDQLRRLRRDDGSSAIGAQSFDPS